MSTFEFDPEPVDGQTDASAAVSDLAGVAARPRVHTVEISDDALASFASEIGVVPAPPPVGRPDALTPSAPHAARPPASTDTSAPVRVGRGAAITIPTALRIACAVIIAVALGPAYARFPSRGDATMSGPEKAPVATVVSPILTRPGAPLLPIAAASAPIVRDDPEPALEPPAPPAVVHALAFGMQPLPSPRLRPGSSSSDVVAASATAVDLGAPPALATLPTVGHVPGGLTPYPVRAAGVRSPAETDRADIESVLNGYKLAYNRLDPVAASSLWPGVDTRALARAFGALSSQRVSFDRCDINLTASARRRAMRRRDHLRPPRRESAAAIAIDLLDLQHGSCVGRVADRRRQRAMIGQSGAALPFPSGTAYTTAHRESASASAWAD